MFWKDIVHIFSGLSTALFFALSCFLQFTRFLWGKKKVFTGLNFIRYAQDQLLENGKLRAIPTVLQSFCGKTDRIM